jgi:hypothetical protein
MSTVAQIPENWPLGLADTSNEFFHAVSSVSPSDHQRDSFQDKATSSKPISTTSTDKLFFGAESNNQANSPAHLAFEPVISSASEKEPLDWKRHDPPLELLGLLEDTSAEIRGLLQSSISALRSRHVEEGKAQQAAARSSKPLRRSERASLRPKIGVGTCE